MGDSTPLNGRTRVPRERLRTELHVVYRETVTGQAKEVARNIGDVSAETVAGWREVSVPGAWGNFIATGRAYPLFALHAVELMGIDLDQDLHAFAKFVEMQRRIRGQ